MQRLGMGRPEQPHRARGRICGDTNRVNDQFVALEMPNRVAKPAWSQILWVGPVQIDRARLFLFAAKNHGDLGRGLQDLHARFAEDVRYPLGKTERMCCRDSLAGRIDHLVAEQRFNHPGHQIFVCIAVGDVAPFHIGLWIVVGVFAPDAVKVGQARLRLGARNRQSNTRDRQEPYCRIFRQTLQAAVKLDAG
jgi:hypothetical protein